MRKKVCGRVGMKWLWGVAAFVLSAFLVNASGVKVQAASEDILALVPEYSGVPCVVLNDNVPFFSEEEKALVVPFEIYTEMDELGRCGLAYVNVCKELMPTEERGFIGHVRPSGWHTANYHDLIDGNYLYNRCHLVAYQLTGENDNVQNLITGTRYMNVQGMLPYENLVANYVNATGNHVLYRVTPIFAGEDLVASGVEMEAWSVEDAGAGICFHVYCYNVQPGFAIAYATGDNALADANVALLFLQTANDPVEAINGVAGTQSVEENYILNTNSGLIHLPNCVSVRRMAERNKRPCTGPIEQWIELGYRPCHNCLHGHTCH